MLFNALKISFAALTLLLVFVSSSSAEKLSEQKAVDIGSQAAGTLLKTLKGELASAIEAGGPVSAVSVCSESAVSVTKDVQTKFPQVKEIKRTTFRYRNPDNAPDKLEAAALRYFEEELKAGKELPSHFIQKEGQDFRFYKPLKIAAVCLTCHGEKEAMPKELASKIKTLYPDDKAYGYELGEFRGVIRVSVGQ